MYRIPDGIQPQAHSKVHSHSHNKAHSKPAARVRAVTSSLASSKSAVRFALWLHMAGNSMSTGSQEDNLPNINIVFAQSVDSVINYISILMHGTFSAGSVFLRLQFASATWIHQHKIRDYGYLKRL